MKAHQSTPWSMFLIAMLMCAYNGVLQATYLLHVAVYPDSWLTSWTFLSGTLSSHLLSFSDYFLAEGQRLS